MMKKEKAQRRHDAKTEKNRVLAEAADEKAVLRWAQAGERGRQVYDEEFDGARRAWGLA